MFSEKEDSSMTNTKVLFVCATQGKRVSRVLKLIEVLYEMNCAVSVVTPGTKTIYSKVQDFLETDTHIPCLIIYLGDGNRAGWRISQTEELPYYDLVQLIATYPKRRISILNDAPYAQMLTKEMIGVRDPVYTSCMTNSRFTHGVVIGEITALALECWNEGLRPEQKISALAPGNLGSYHTLPIWQRWGEYFEDWLLREDTKKNAA